MAADRDRTRAAWAAHDDEQRRPVADGDRDSILVFFAMPDEAQVCVLDLQGSLRHARCHVELTVIYST